MKRKVIAAKYKVIASLLWRYLLHASFILLLAGFGATVSAQHEQHDMKNMPGMDKPTPTPAPTPIATPTPTDKHDMHDEHTGAMPAMNMAGGTTDVSEADVRELMVMSNDEMAIRVGKSAKNLMPMGQIASGTSWQPASSPMNMYHKPTGDWVLMLHFDFKAGVNHQGGLRGVTKAEAMNWFMPMAFRRVGAGTLQLRGMFSIEPFTFPRGGSPLLFQTGESFKGAPLIDRQHPHDLFMELSAQYTAPLGERATWFAYFGYPGEPALGPVAFMHRASAAENPSAPLAHHLEDSTHISFGVFTTGFTYRWFKLEGSLFNGREPDENRYNFEAHTWNSRAARLSFAPNNNWTFQLSHGFLRNPEALEPGDTRRTTASVQYERPFTRGSFAAALIWGRNHERHDDNRSSNLNGYTGEATYNFRARNYLYTRLELVDKNELLRPQDRALLGITDKHASFRVGAYTFGYVRDLFDTGQLLVGLGGDATVYAKPAALDALYGRSPVSYKIFFRIRPSLMRMHDHAGHTSGH